MRFVGIGLGKVFSKDWVEDAEKFSSVISKVMVSIAASKNPLEAIDILSELYGVDKEIIHAGFILGKYTVINASFDIGLADDYAAVSIRFEELYRYIDWYIAFYQMLEKDVLSKYKLKKNKLEKIRKAVEKLQEEYYNRLIEIIESNKTGGE